MKSFEEDSTVDKNKVEIIDGIVCCKEHGAMNLLNGIWRCYTQYKGNPDGIFHKGVKPYKFIDRVCNAAILDKEVEK